MTTWIMFLVLMWPQTNTVTVTSQPFQHKAACEQSINILAEMTEPFSPTKRQPEDRRSLRDIPEVLNAFCIEDSPKPETTP
jgi:hypothetical protein